MYLMTDQNIQSKNLQRKKLKRKIGNSTIIIGDFKNSLSIMTRITRRKISKEVEDLDNTINQLNLRDIYKHST